MSGPLEPSSECYVMNVLGQQIYLESSDIPEIEEGLYLSDVN